MSSDKYVKHAITDVELVLAQNDQCLQLKVHTPLSSGYHPELHSSPELNMQHANCYQGPIGVLQNELLNLEGSTSLCLWHICLDT